MSLLEIVIAMGLVAILLSLAVPAYRQYSLRGYRVAAIGQLLDAAHCQERIYAAEFGYDTTRCVPSDTTGHYRFSFEPADAVGSMVFAVRADPAGPQRDDPCGSLALDHTGRRSSEGAAETVRTCWAGR